MSFSKIKFNKGSHTYILGNKKLTSVTNLISTLEPPVDWSAIAAKKAQREGTSTDLILSLWKQKGTMAMAKGTKVHSYIEHYLRFNSKLDYELPETKAWDTFWKEGHKSLTPVHVEWVVGDYQLGIGGTIDCFFFSEKTKRHHVFDWKTGENFKLNNPYQNLLPPFEHLENCELIKYSLQLSAYKLILKRNLELAIGESYIIRLTDEFFKVQALDFSKEIEDWLLTKKK